MTFRFEGELPASKSLWNRWAVIRSFDPRLSLRGHSTCDDVVKMNEALPRLLRGGEDVDCGEAGTVLRFLAFRASRIPGRHRLMGSPRLFTRPQTEIPEILEKLGVSATLSADALVIEGQGWQRPKGTLKIPRSRSSQFLSGLVLSAWDLPFALPIELEGDAVSELYWRMTRMTVLKAGMKLSGGRPGTFEVLPRQRVRLESADVEPDLSSAFAVAALAARGGGVWIKNFPEASIQPDLAFVDLLTRMGMRTKKKWPGLEIAGVEKLRGIEADLRDTPDLFPVLASLAALAEGPSRLAGAPHLVHKESDRIARVAELLTKVGARVQSLADGLEVLSPAPAPTESVIDFDAGGDHRLVMAAWTLKRAGYPLRIAGEDSVAKSFPEYPGIVRG